MDFRPYAIAIAVFITLWLVIELSSPIGRHVYKSITKNSVTVDTKFYGPSGSWDCFYGQVINKGEEIAVRQVWQFRGESTQAVYTVSKNSTAHITFGHQTALHIYRKGVEVAFIPIGGVVP